MPPTEKRVQQQIRTVERLLQAYGSGHEPLARFLTGFYKLNRQMGSSDRRTVSRLVYNYFRIGKALSDSKPDVRLAIAEFLCSDDSGVVRLILPDLYPYQQADLPEKIERLQQVHAGFKLADVFPYAAYLSLSIDQTAFAHSFFIQPDLFIRLKRANRTEVLDALDIEKIDYKRLGDFQLSLPNRTALDRIPAIQGKYEVQDLSSQQTGKYVEATKDEYWWDACSGSGGKSLLLMDSYPGVNLLVSDTRNTILRNLDERFDVAGIKSYRRKIIDLTKDTNVILQGEQFDGIILDAPCSGSGTWGRTPEMITWFDDRSIDRFSTLQKQLASNVIKHLKPGKPLIYITCSAFSSENEEVVRYLQTEHKMALEKMEVLHGYRQRADTMFVARLIR